MTYNVDKLKNQKDQSTTTQIGRIKQQLIQLEAKRQSLASRLDLVRHVDKPFYGTYNEYLALGIDEAAKTIICLQDMGANLNLDALEKELTRINLELDKLPLNERKGGITQMANDRGNDHFQYDVAQKGERKTYYFPSQRTAGCIFIENFNPKDLSKVNLKEHNFVYVMTTVKNENQNEKQKVYLIEAQNNGRVVELAPITGQEDATLDPFKKTYESASEVIEKLNGKFKSTHATPNSSFQDGESYCDMAVVNGHNEITPLGTLLSDKTDSNYERFSSYTTDELRAGSKKDGVINDIYYDLDDEVRIKNIATPSAETKNTSLSQCVNDVVSDAKKHAEKLPNLGLKHKIIKVLDAIAAKLGFGPDVKLGNEVKLQQVANSAGFFAKSTMKKPDANKTAVVQPDQPKLNGHN